MIILRAFLVGAILVFCESKSTNLTHIDELDENKIIGKVCQTSEGLNNGVCELEEKCPHIAKLHEDGEKQTVKSSGCEIHPSIHLVCCPPANITTKYKPPRNLRVRRTYRGIITIMWENSVPMPKGYTVTLNELTTNQSRIVNVESVAGILQFYTFTDVAYGGDYQVSVSANSTDAEPATISVDGHKLPTIRKSIILSTSSSRRTVIEMDRFLCCSCYCP